MTPISSNHIAQTPKVPHALIDNKQYQRFKIENEPTVVNIFHLHY